MIRAHVRFAGHDSVRPLRLILLLLFRALMVSAVFALLIVAARLFGSKQALPEALINLHLTDCALPCWLGVVPGVTPFGEAVQRISAQYSGTVMVRTSLVIDTYQIDTAFGSVGVLAD